MLLKQTEEYRTNSEDEAKNLMEKFRQDSKENGYTIGKMGYTYKTKKAKGEIIDEAWVLSITKVIRGVWDEY